MHVTGKEERKEWHNQKRARKIELWGKLLLKADNELKSQLRQVGNSRLTSNLSWHWYHVSVGCTGTTRRPLYLGQPPAIWKDRGWATHGSLASKQQWCPNPRPRHQKFLLYNLLPELDHSGYSSGEMGWSQVEQRNDHIKLNCPGELWGLN